MGPRRKARNPISSSLVPSYLKCTTEEQRQVQGQVKQAPAILSHALKQLVRGTCGRFEVRARGPPIQRPCHTMRGFFCVAFHNMRPGLDLSCALGLQVLRMPQFAGLILTFISVRRCGRRAVEVHANLVESEMCAVRGVHEYSPAALSIGCDVSTGYLSPAVSQGGNKQSRALTASQMTAMQQSHLLEAEMPDKHFTMHSSRHLVRIPRIPP